MWDDGVPLKKGGRGEQKKEEECAEKTPVPVGPLSFLSVLYGACVRACAPAMSALSDIVAWLARVSVGVFIA